MMKVSRQQLRSIIKEELSAVLHEADSDGDGRSDKEELEDIAAGMEEEEDEYRYDFDPHYEQEMERVDRAKYNAERAEEKKKFLKGDEETGSLGQEREWIEEFIAEDPDKISMVAAALSKFYDGLMDEMGYSDWY
tara:strand:- start:5162 stop:5566 length:405 start_codon:yes stop_codon:yes gene_type:complete